MTPRLSVIVITLNEERDLPACLDSVAGLSPEIVIVDGGSGDRTLALARERTPHVFHSDFSGFASQKRAALEKASGDWVLSLDADERATPELCREIEGVLSRREGPSGYEIPYEVRFMGRRLRFGGLGRERHLRLFRREAGRFVGGILHEGVAVAGGVGRLGGRIRHEPYRDLDEYLEKMRRYTEAGAKKRLEAGARFSPLDHLRPLWELFTRVVLKGAWLDGTPGLAWAGLACVHTWVKYLRVRELSRAREAA